MRPPFTRHVHVWHEDTHSCQHPSALSQVMDPRLAKLRQLAPVLLNSPQTIWPKPAFGNVEAVPQGVMVAILAPVGNHDAVVAVWVLGHSHGMGTASLVQSYTLHIGYMLPASMDLLPFDIPVLAYPCTSCRPPAVRHHQQLRHLFSAGMHVR